MAKAKTNLGVPADIAAQLNSLEKRQKTKAKGESLGMVAISGGNQISIEDLVGSDIRPDNLYYHSDFTNVEPYLKNPNPECKYVWMVFDRKNGIKSDSYRSDSLYQGVRSGELRPVSIDELKDDANLPISSMEAFGDSSAGAVESVVMKGLVLIEVQPKAVKERYKQRELLAAIRSNPKLGENIMRNSLNSLGVSEEQVAVETVTRARE